MFKSCTVDNVFVLRWVKIEPGDPAKMLEGLRTASAAARQKLIGIMIVPVECPIPVPTERKELSAAIEPALGHCSTLNLVLEGQGIQKTAIRAVAAGIFLVSGKKSSMQVFETFGSVLTKRVEPALARRVLAKARETGCITADESELAATA